jgi:hypothetical protein
MFTDFLKTLYLRGTKFNILSLTLYDDPETVKASLSTNLKAGFNLILVKETKVLNMQNKSLIELMGVSDVTVSLKPGTLEDLGGLKVSPESSLEWQGICDRWKMNLDLLANRHK